MGGGVTRKLLNTVTDPSGRQLVFSWTNFGTVNAPAYRITYVAGPLYNVSYAYFTNANDPASYLNLQSVTLDPGGLARTTSFTYTSYTGANGTENGLLASISDPLSHAVSYSYTYPSQNPTSTVWVTTVTEPGSGGNHVWTLSPSSFNYLGTFTTGLSSNGSLSCRIDTDQYLRYLDTQQGTGLTYSISYCQTPFRSDPLRAV
jgi:hypothetical protein